MKKHISLYLVLASSSLLFAQNSTEKLEDIIVSGTKLKEKKSKVPMSIDVKTAKDQLKEGSTSLYDTFANEVGVSVTGGEGRSQNITIRGISGNRIKVVKDGISISDGYGANNLNDVVGMNTFDFTNMKEIEVLKGANSSLQGSGTLGGLIIVNTKQLSDYLQNKDFNFEAISKYSGISGKYLQNLSIAKRIGKLELGLRGNYSKSQETKNYEKTVYNRDVKSKNIAIMQAYSFDNAYFKNSYEHFDENANRQEGSSPIQPDGIWKARKFDETKDTVNDEFMSNLLLYLNDKYDQELDIKLYYRNTKNTQDLDALIHKTSNSLLLKRLQKDHKIFQDKIFGADLDITADISDNHIFKYGLSLKKTFHDRYIQREVLQNGNSTSIEKRPFAQSDTKEFAFYFIDKYTYDKLSINTSLRFDDKELTGESTDNIKADDKNIMNLSPSLSLTYQINDDFNVYSSYSYGFKSPTYDKVYGYAPHRFNSIFDFILVPNTDLKEENSHNYEIGTKYNDEKNYFHFALFYSKYKNFIEPKTVGYNDVEKYQIKKYVNVKKVKIYGFETSYSHKFNNNLTLSTALGLIDGFDEEDERITTLTPLEGNIKAQYDYKNSSSFLRANFASSMKRVPTCVGTLDIEGECATTKAWASLDAGISYNFSKNYNINLSVFNILDKRYIKYQDVSGRTSDLTNYSARASRYFNASFKMEF